MSEHRALSISFSYPMVHHEQWIYGEVRTVHTRVCEPVDDEPLGDHLAPG